MRGKRCRKGEVPAGYTCYPPARADLEKYADVNAVHRSGQYNWGIKYLEDGLSWMQRGWGGRVSR